MTAINLTSPHVTGRTSVSWVMGWVLLALVPGWVVLTVSFSIGYAINMALAMLTALIAEALILAWRKRPVLFFLKDLSALVTAALLALALPPLGPWWLTVLGTLIAIIFAKQLFGGPPPASLRAVAGVVTAVYDHALGQPRLFTVCRRHPGSDFCRPDPGRWCHRRYAAGCLQARHRPADRCRGAAIARVW